MIRQALLALLVSLAVARPALALEGGGSEPAPGAQVAVLGVDQTRYPRVEILFQARRPGGEPLPAGALQGVRLSEGLPGGGRAEISGWKLEPAGHRPIRILVLVDLSGSMEARVGPGTKLDAVKVALVAMVELLQPGDQLALMTYHLEPGPYVLRDERPGLDLGDRYDFPTGDGYTADRAAMLGAVEGLAVPRGYTAYTNVFNAVARAIEWDRARRNPADPATQLLLLSDGMDDRADVVARAAAALGSAPPALGPGLQVEDVVEEARAAGVVVHTIGFGDPGAPPGLDLGSIRIDQLERLAAGSQGRFAFAPDPEGLTGLHRMMAADLRAGWLLTYVAPGSYRGAPDGSPRGREVLLSVLVDGRWEDAQEKLYTPALVVGLPPEAGDRADRGQLLVAGLMGAANVGILLAILAARAYRALFARWWVHRHRHLAAARFTPDMRGPRGRGGER